MFSWFAPKLLAAAVIALPLQTSLMWRPEWSSVGGLPLNFTSPVVYLSQIILYLSFLTDTKNTWAYIRSFINHHRALTLVGLTLISINILFSSSPMVSLFSWTKLLYLPLIFILCRLYIHQINLPVLLVIGYVFSSILALLQFWQQSHLGGLFRLMGEPLLSLSNPQIAKIFIPPLNIFGHNLFADTYLRAYATFSHPNALAGYLAIGLILSPMLLSQLKNRLLFAVICLMAIISTFSRSAMFALSIVFVYTLPIRSALKTVLLASVATLSVAIFIITKQYNNDSYIVRAVLNEIALENIAKYPVFGTGLGAYPVLTGSQLDGRIDYRQLVQPVHNVFLLVVVETGIVGVVALITFIKLLKLQYNHLSVSVFAGIMFIVITGYTDHYWLTSWQNISTLVVLGTVYLVNKT